MEMKEHKTIYSRHCQESREDVAAGWVGKKKDCRETTALASVFSIQEIGLMERRTR
jgi:hypothetical protein